MSDDYGIGRAMVFFAVSGAVIGAIVVQVVLWFIHHIDVAVSWVP